MRRITGLGIRRAIRRPKIVGRMERSGIRVFEKILIGPKILDWSNL